MQSGGIIIALSAVLWLAYLLPTWLHRRQYMATERNAVRLQQTLRILAETAEVPDAVRAETNARSVVEQQRALRRAAEEAEAAARARDAAAQRALPKVAPVSATSPSAATRLRRSRLAATAILALALVGVIAGIAQVAGAGAWTLLVISSLATMGSLAILQRMSQVAAARRLQAPEARPRPQTGFTDFHESAEQPVAPVAGREEGESWTPVPVPKPLYLSRSQAPGPRPGAGSAPRTPLSPVEEMRRAAAASEETLRRAHLEPEVARLSAEEEAAASAAPAAPAARTAPVSRFSRMGIVDDAEPGMGDLDEVLRRRRAVG
ncbi:hypothetical protein [Clavibacter nebraskensis]|uniref:Large exoprotein n=2 Tax=Clavibacter nebraskensis TaxID=31963 RepID=A0ABY4MPG7_9MICO|nr:hypothetical protein [Clavibacter nebraskensis]KXU19865.1 hypothetical protein VV38_11545 [Clavibacter nebraskensis]OAH18414.1 hypothetical protein A3Q38_11300 [Clavibacter nebraskensis]QGV67469.1 hypothetical protein EGX36_11940 [Clavibacter nebraskensis]QGV70269.1 hypothetical protein EGX37_11895 [Clavibacter nebraskensis]QGV73060.1 hypothetical protein EGX35_11895 [Clavibacter nebraskensis]